jgi:hypothetical protein
MKYRILNAVRPLGGGLAFIAQPHSDRPGVVARGVVDLAVPPGLLAANLSAVVVEGEVWELELADDRATVIGATYRGEEQTA